MSETDRDCEHCGFWYPIRQRFFEDQRSIGLCLAVPLIDHRRPVKRRAETCDQWKPKEDQP